MRTQLILFILMYFLQDAFFHFDVDFLSKFHQNDYKMKDLRIQLISFDENYYHFFRITAFKYNRSTTAHNMTWKGKFNAQDKMEALVQFYKFLSNEFRDFPVRFQANLQKMYKANIVGFAEAANCGNFTTCIFQKDVTYHICNFVLDEAHFPPLMPAGRYNIEVQLLFLNRPVVTLDIFVEIVYPIIPRKKKRN